MRLAGILAILGAAAAAASAFGVARAAESPLGKTLTGESCQWREAPASGATKTVPIACGESGATAGTLYVAPIATPLPAAAAAHENGIDAALRSLPGATGKACDKGESLAGDGDRRLIFCGAAGSAPRLVLVTVLGHSLYVAEGSATMLPVLEAAVATESGTPFSPQVTEAAIRLVEARSPGLTARTGGADVASYKALIELARLDSAGRDYAGAEAAYRRVLAIQTRLFGANSIDVGETLAELALQVSNQGRFDEAAALFRRAEPILNTAPEIAIRARLASYRALDAANQRHFADALKFAQATTAMRRAELAAASPPDSTERAPAANRGELAHSLRIEALMALRLGDLSTALADATEVLRIINDEPSLPLWWRPEAVSMMAEIDTRRARVVPAEREFREAIAMQRKLFGDTAPTAMAEMRLGTFYSDQQVYGAAVDAFKPALDILQHDEIARATIGPDQIIPYLIAVVGLEKNEPNRRAALDQDAFRASQLVGSDVADQTIARTAARLGANDPKLADLLRRAQDAQRQRDSLRIELAAETAKPDDRRDPLRERDLALELRQVAERADALGAQIKTAFPSYVRLADPGPVDLAEMQQRLRQGEAFLSFAIGTRTSFALLVTQQGLTLAHLDLTASAIDKDVAELRRAFVPRLGKLADFDVEASYEFYRRLVGPLAPKLEAIDHLIVAPSGALASLPLALLVTAAPAGGASHNYAQAAWLVRRMAVSEVPSPRSFLSLRAEAEHHTPAPDPLLAVADPSFTGPSGDSDALEALADRCRENGPMNAAVLRALAPLKETANEVRIVAGLLGPGTDTILLGTAASERNFRAQRLDQYRVLYFATHGMLPGELHCQAEPALVLSPPAVTARTTAGDGLLEASEIAALKLNADLVVLSACNTATSGGGFGGEALAGLAGAFFNAGARAVLASHWEVPSLATEKLMTGLFQDLSRDGGHGLAQALRQSQLRLIADPATAHPFDWAAFTIIGDGAAAVRIAATPAGKEAERGRT